MADVHLDVVGERGLHEELGRRVVAVVDRGMAVLVVDGELPLHDLDGGRAGILHADGPLADVDVVGAPVGELAAGILVPPARPPRRIAMLARWQVVIARWCV